MIRLRADWHQACSSCGTELVVNFMNHVHTEHVCPWCGARIKLQLVNASQDTIERLKQALSELEASINSEIPSDGTD